MANHDQDVDPVKMITVIDNIKYLSSYHINLIGALFHATTLYLAAKNIQLGLLDQWEHFNKNKLMDPRHNKEIFPNLLAIIAAFFEVLAIMMD